MSDKEPVPLLTAEMVRLLRTTLGPADKYAENWKREVSDILAAFDALDTGRTTCIPTAELARLRARVAEMEAAEPFAWTKNAIDGPHVSFIERNGWLPLYLGPRRMTEAWQPIESAPKDGTFIWLGRPGSIRIGFWSAERWADYARSENASGRRDLLFTPTHWMPLPAPPAIKDPT